MQNIDLRTKEEDAKLLGSEDELSKCHDVLRQLCPGVFSYTHPRPLCLDIEKALCEKLSIHHPEISHELLVRYLRDYVTRSGYINACRFGALRVNAEGKPAGIVTLSESTRIYSHRQRLIKHQDSQTQINAS